MQKRILFLVMVSISVVLIGIGIVSYLNVQKSIDHAMDAHVMLAELAGKNIDNIIKRNVARLQDLSLPGIIDLNEEQWEYEFNALRSAFEHSIFTDGVFIADLDGNVLMTYPHLDDGEMNLLALPYMDEAISEDRTVVSNVYTDERTGRKVIYVLVPKKNDKGQTIGVVGGEINPSNYLFNSILSSISADRKTCIELVDSFGTVITSNKPERILMHSDHNKFLARAIDQRRSFIGECHRCHVEPGSPSEREMDVLAFVPLSLPPWGVSVRDPASEVYAPASALQKAFLLVSLIVVIASIALSLGLSRSIVRPLRLLTDAAGRMAEGNLSDAINVNRRDEIGKLAIGFETMRRKLDESLRSIQDYNVQLEHRVLERTRELHERKRQLASLLKEGMKHQEDERRRLARELHDETSQNLAAIGMSLEIAMLALHQNELEPEMLSQIRMKVGSLVDGINRIIQNLRPPVLDDLGLKSAISWLFEKQFAQHDIQYSVNADGFDGIVLDKRNELRIFRVIQEATTNIVRHAQTQFVCFSAVRNSDGLGINIIDTGVGFDVESGMDTAGFDGSLAGYGLLGMRERISQMSGKLHISSYPNEGTHVQILIPVHKLEELNA